MLYHQAGFWTIIAANREYNSRVIVIQTLVQADEALLKQQYYQLLFVSCAPIALVRLTTNNHR